MKPIIFCDFDGTICHEQYWRSLPPEQHAALQKLLFGDDTQIFQEWLRGGHTAEAVNQYAANALGLPYEELWELFVKDCQTMTVSPFTLAKLNDLRDNYTVILMTGNMDSFSRFTVPALNLEQYFDAISNSYYEGIHKTDNKGELFLTYTDRYGADIKKCYLLDDSVKVCDIFFNLGGKALLVSSDKPVDDYLAEF